MVVVERCVNVRALSDAQRRYVETQYALFREWYRSEERRVGEEWRSRWSPYH